MVQGRTGSGNVVPLMVRVPEDLRDRIKAAADANGRSQNSEIVATLEERYPAPVYENVDLWHGYYAELTRNLSEIQDIFESMRSAEGEYLSSLQTRIDALFSRDEELIRLMDEMLPVEIYEGKSAMEEALKGGSASKFRQGSLSVRSRRPPSSSVPSSDQSDY